MDLNFHLLESDQIKLLQDISSKKNCKCSGHAFDGFAQVRDKLDVVILDDSTGSDMFEKCLKEEEEEIRKHIKEEQDARNDPEDPFCQAYEPFPRLPNYDDPDNPEPLWMRWDECEAMMQGGRIPEGDYIDAADYVVASCLNNYDLYLLDQRLGRIKWYRQRLHGRGMSGVQWSGSLLGCYSRSIKVENGRNNKIFLFLDTIKDYAEGSGVSATLVLAETFVHEMFHAFYGDTYAKDFMKFYHIMEIEEAVTECSMLMFIREFYKGYLSFAESDVRGKFSCGDPMLQCYGLGYYLYENILRNVSFSGLFEKYQKIQRAPRFSVPIVRKYVRDVRTPGVSSGGCVDLLLKIIEHFDGIINSAGKHYMFNGRQYGWESKLAQAVFQYYADMYPSRDFAQMQIDFGAGYYDKFFQDRSVAEKGGMIGKLYDGSFRITLSDGTEIILAKTWEKDSKKGNFLMMVNTVKCLFAARVIDKVVNILR